MKMRNISFSAALFLLIFMMVAAMSTAAAGEAILGKQNAAEAAACGRCGDGYCAKQCGENAQSCPTDCGVEEARACGKCGDGYCARQCGETAQSCPKDCGVETQSIIPKPRR